MLQTTSPVNLNLSFFSRTELEPFHSKLLHYLHFRCPFVCSCILFWFKSDQYDYEVLEIDLRRAVMALEAHGKQTTDERKTQDGGNPSERPSASADKKGSILDLHRRPPPQ